MVITGSFVKENFFLIGFPLFLFCFIPIKNFILVRKKAIGLAVVSLLCGLALFLIKENYPEVPSSYSDYYSVTISNIILALRLYLKQIIFTQFAIPILALIYTLYDIYKNYSLILSGVYKKGIIVILLWIQVFIQIIFLLPWEFALGRYLLLVNINLALIYAIIIGDIFNIFEKYIFINFKWLNFNRSFCLIVFFVLITTVPLVRNLFTNANLQSWQILDSGMSYSSVQSLARNIPDDAELYYNFKQNDTNLEIYYGTNMHLSELYGRDDIQSKYIEESNLCTNKPRYIFDRTSDRFYSVEIFENEHFEVVDKGMYNFRPINYGMVLKSFLVGSKLQGWSMNTPFDWAIYKQTINTCIK